MNVLGFVSSLLIVVSLYTAAMNSDLVDLARFKSSYKNYFEASRSAQNKYETAYYKSKKTPRIKKGETVQHQVSKEPPKEYKSEDRPPCARLNLAFLFEPTPNQERLELFSSLLKTLYGKNLLYQSKEGLKKLLQAMTEPKEKTTFLGKLQFKDAETQKLFYRMLKGALKSDGYYPSLLDYVLVTFEEPDSKICLACADHTMLTALFGEKAALRLEKRKNDPDERLKISRSELEKILMEENHKLPAESVLKLIRFTHPKKNSSDVTSTATEQDVQVKKRGKL